MSNDQTAIMQTEAATALAGVLDSTTLERATTPGVHDAVVIGSGASGGLAALLLTEAGLRVLVLEAGWRASSQLSSWRCWINAGAQRLAAPSRFIPPIARIALLRSLGLFYQPVQSRCSAWSRTPNAFVDDRDCPYQSAPNKPFVWIRSRQLGGRMMVPGHGRQYYRLSESDFAPT